MWKEHDPKKKPFGFFKRKEKILLFKKHKNFFMLNAQLEKSLMYQK
jgi:hypothetical protein